MATWYFPKKPKNDMKKKEQDPIGKFLPWYKGVIDVDESGNRIYFKSPFQMIASIRLSTIFDRIPRIAILLFGIAVGANIILYVEGLYVDNHPVVREFLLEHVIPDARWNATHPPESLPATP